MENSVIKKPNLSHPMLRIRKSMLQQHQVGLSTPKLSSHRGSLFQNSIDSNTSSLFHPSLYVNSNRDDYHVKYENTYQLGPVDGQKFNIAIMEKLVEDVLEKYLHNCTYDQKKSRDLVKVISDEIKQKVKQIVYKRYKLVISLTIGQNLGQDTMVTSRSLWNTETDNYCTVQFKNHSLFSIATIWASYYD